MNAALRPLSILAVICSAIALAASGCAGRLAAEGTLAHLHIHGRVDSTLARDYLRGRALPSELDDARHQHSRARAEPTRDELAVLARAYSPDVAMLLFIEAVASRPENRALREQYVAELHALRGLGLEAAHFDGADDVVVLFVPGWFYLKHGAKTGADFHEQRAVLTKLGVSHELVPTDENGTVEANARTVARTIRRHADAQHRLIVVSASKSGAEVALALGRELAVGEGDAVRAWLSIGGVVRGSPVADRVLEPDLCWFVRAQLRREGYDLAGLRSMRTSVRRPAFDDLEFPPHLLLVAYVAAPLSGDITRRAEFGYVRMRKHGPNDGLTLLADELLPGGLALVEPGVDHFFEGADQRRRTVAMLRVLLQRIDELENAGRSRALPEDVTAHRTMDGRAAGSATPPVRGASGSSAPAP